MVTCGKRRLLSPLSVAAILFLAAFAVACGDTAPTVAPELQAPAMEPTSAPAVTAEQEASTSPQAPVASSGQTTGAGEPLPTATSVPPSPTSTPPPKPAGYLHGAEHGIALLQTTRQPSETREGWVDISLTLATLKFGGDVASREHQVEPNSMCYVNRQPPDDCLFIAWGSEEQFEAEIRVSHWTSDPGRALKTDILVVTFEAAANANKASLYFGDQHKIPIDLQGDAPPVEPNADPALAPAPSASSGKSAGYFVDIDYGIAVTGVVRRGQSSSHPTISLIDVYISVLSLAEGEEVAAAINVGVADNSDICLGHSSRMECLKIKWGPESQFDAALVIENEINVAWPRGMGLQLPFRFVVPSSTEQATVEFGEHQIPIDLKGMTGEAPAYDYRLHYQELAAGSTLYASNQKRVVLEAIRQEEDSGRIVLVFNVTNDSEAADFAPAIALAGSRVSESGTVFDGELHAAAGWTPPTYQFELGRLAPGQNTKTEIAISRVVGEDRERWRLISYSPNPEERPDGVVLQLIVSDSLTDAGTAGPISGYAAYDRFPRESDYWAGTLLWRYETGGNGDSAPTVSNGAVYVGSWNGHIHALDAATGDILWQNQVNREGSPDSSPAVSGGIVYVGSWEGHIYALDAATGDLLWRYQVGVSGSSGSSSPAVSGGVAYFVGYWGGDSLRLGNASLFALDAVTGNLLWRFGFGDYKPSSPAVSGGIVYVGFWNGHIYALDAVTGNLLWRHDTDGMVDSSPAVSGGVVYVGSNDHHLYALDAATGELLWRYETDSMVDSSPAVSGGVVYVGSRYGHLYALDAATGELLWRYDADSRVGSAPAVSGGVVYVGSDDHHLYALDAATGELLWRYNAGSRAGASPVVSGGVVYMGSDSGDLHAIAAAPPR